MRVIVWGINYAPEFTGIAPHSVALCDFLHTRGDDVSMVTGFAYYPSWEKRPDDRGHLYRTDLINGVPVHRCWQFVPKRVSALKRIFHEASFVFTSTLRALSLPRPDVYVLVSPPLLLGVVGWLVGKIKHAPFVFHVQDMQPDAAVGLGMLKASWFTRVLYWLEAFAYRHAARVSGITQGMLKSFRGKGVPESKLVYFPNAIALNDAGPPPARGEFRSRHEFAPEEFLAVYAGNLGVKQGLEVLLETAPLLRDPRIRILICGDGAQRESLTNRVRELKLPNVSMLPLQAGRDYRALLVDADVCFITQQIGAGNSFFPSKLLGLLAESKPVVTVAAPECELALSLAEGKFGVNVAPGNARELADLLDSLASDPERLAEFGAAGRRYVEQFEKGNVMQNFARELEALRAS
ncbi:MAG: colanic acid biosynthesis glycosyl transferase WcaI [Verrucomicrobiota bacterium]|jgi:colanic acid biosynthesis glycosyl transferase WcaI